VSLNKHVTSR